ncbi:MAG: U32 family peptidase, partial [Alistipes sp.]|nr:U32 family peptidase [Alistipes sp.]
AEHTSAYGSSAVRRKVYVGRVTNFFKKIGVAEVLIEAAELSVGDNLLWMGATTGVVEQTLGEIRFEEKSVESVRQGDLCSIKVEQTLHRGDKLYKEVER